MQSELNSSTSPEVNTFSLPFRSFFKKIYKKSPASRKYTHSGQRLPKHGFVYFEHLQAEYKHKILDPIPENDLNILKHINKKAEDATLTWSDIYIYESIFLRYLNDDCLPRKVWDLRNRYRDVIGLKEYEAYLASKPPEISGIVKFGHLRADIDFLLSKIYLKYSLSPFNEQMHSSISRKVMIGVLIGLAFIFVAGVYPSIKDYYQQILPEKGNLLFENDPLPSATILMVLFAGAMGGLMSMLQRYSNFTREGDPISSIVEYPWYQIFVPAINGALFAVLLYVFFLGGLIQGGFFPDFSKDNTPAGIRSGLIAFLTEYGNKIKGTEYAKLIIWSFIAGFAERYVPDTLSKFIAKKENVKESINT